MINRMTATRLLLVAAGLHLMLTMVIYFCGRQGVSPSLDQHGCTVTISPDCVVYIPDVTSLAEVLTSDGPLAWLKTPAQIHVRIYSLPAALLGSRVNSLTAEPVNI